MSARCRRKSRERLNAWIDKGGVLVRFAGPRLAQADDDLVPVKLRRGGRTLGGSLTWEKPQHLASFAADGPFAGLAVPKDVTVTRQVLAEPDAALADARAGRRWTTARRWSPASVAARAWSALFHVSADMRWSDLPMSGTFVEMLRRVVDMSGYTAHARRRVLRPSATPNRGAAAARSTASARSGRRRRRRKPLPADYRDRATTDHPPGLYGPADGPLAVNTLAAPDRIAPLDYRALRARPRHLHQCRAAAICAACCCRRAGAVPDRRHHRRCARRRHRGAAAAPRARRTALIACAGARAACHDRAARPARADSAADEFAHEGGRRRPGSPMWSPATPTSTPSSKPASRASTAVSGAAHGARSRRARSASTPARDELAFFPLIYWPIVPGAPKPPQDALDQIDAYMKQGGTVLFDTRDAVEAPPGSAATRADAGHADAARHPRPRSMCPRSSRCRPTMC